MLRLRICTLFGFSLMVVFRVLGLMGGFLWISLGTRMRSICGCWLWLNVLGRLFRVKGLLHGIN